MQHWAEMGQVAPHRWKFDTYDCYYFGLNLSQVLLIKSVAYKKTCDVVFSLLNMKK